MRAGKTRTGLLGARISPCDVILADFVAAGKYLARGHGARSIRHDLGPNIVLSGPPTESIST